MKQLVIGTAGHVDHGKTQLVKALTGVDTDRLPEEKQRGLTIELGYAHLLLPEGVELSLVDVPGHERFIKNMLAGAGGIDLAMLVVAADEGVMPQTREHFHILCLLGLRSGLIVLTKTDLADAAQQQEVCAQLDALTRGSFLQDAPIVPVCAHTGEGIPALWDALAALAADTPQKNADQPWRLPIDRIFTVDGFGTVAAGTLTEGTLTVGEGMLYPQGTPVRMRGLQVHGTAVDQARAGQRVAVNLSGVKKDAVHRGDLLAAPDSLCASMMLDVRLHLLPDAAHGVANGARLHLYIGAKAALCKAVLLGRDALAPGDSGFAQLRCAEPLAVRVGDRFIVRFYSPLETIGGGIVLDPTPARHKHSDPDICTRLMTVENGTAEPIVPHTPTQALMQQLERFHAKFPMQSGMPVAQARLLIPDAPDDTLAQLAQAGSIRLEESFVALADFTPVYPPRCARILARLEAEFAAAPFAPPTLTQLSEQFADAQPNLRKVIAAMRADGRLVALSADVILSRTAYAQAVQLMRAHFAQESCITVAALRDRLGTSRKYARALLEYWDKAGVTQRVGDVHLPYNLERA